MLNFVDAKDSAPIPVEGDPSVEIQGRGGSAWTPDKLLLGKGVRNVKILGNGPGPDFLERRWWESCEPIARVQGGFALPIRQIHEANVFGLEQGE